MASTYSTSLRLELMANGDQSGTWGATTNTNLGTLLEQSITGYLSKAQGDVANLTLTTLNGGSDEARNVVLDFTGALTAARNVIVPTVEKTYLVKNSTTGGFALTIKTSAGTGVSLSPGVAQWVYCDGTNVVSGLGGPLSDIQGLSVTDGNFIVGDGTNWVTESGSTALTSLGAVPLAGGTMTGVLNMGGQNITKVNSIFLTEQAAADADVAGDGQFWVATATPNIPKFTDDAGTDFDLLTSVEKDTSPTLGGTLAGAGFDLTGLGTVSLTEQAAANVDVAGQGQLWVKTATPNELWFTDDAGTDVQLGVPSGNEVYIGGTSSNLSYPVGTCVLTRSLSDTAVQLNAYYPVKNYDTEKNFATTIGSGLTGAWRCRGSIGQNGGSGTLYQRTF